MARVVIATAAVVLFGCHAAPPVAMGSSANARLRVDVHWRGNNIIAEATVQRDVEVSAAHEFVLNDSDYLATGRLSAAVPLVLAGATALPCRRPAIAPFVDTDTSELREPLGNRGAVICHWPGVTGRRSVTIIAPSALGAQAHYIVSLDQKNARMVARYHVPTELLGTVAHPMQGSLALWYWGPSQATHADGTDAPAAGGGQPLLDHAATVAFRGGVVLIERTATVAISNHVAFHDEFPHDTVAPIVVTDEVELAASPMPLMADSALTLRLADGTEQALHGAAMINNRFITGPHAAITVDRTVRDYRVRGGRAVSHKYVLRNFSATATVVECWMPTPAKPLGFWQAPDAIVGAHVQRDRWSMIPVTVPANGETWIARGWRLP